MPTDVHAVLTGDVIQSGTLEGYGEILGDTFGLFQEEHEEHLLLPVDRFSGDRFQILMNDPVNSLRAALYIFSKLASQENQVHVRISIGLGRVEAIPDQRVSIGDGEAFRLSGSYLESMKRHQWVMFEGSDNFVDRDFNRLFQGSMELLSALLMDLSPAQAGVLWYKLQDYTQDEIAAETNRKQQSISDIAIAGHWRNIESFLTIYEQQIKRRVKKQV